MYPCDNCNKMHHEVRLLPIGGSSNVILCYDCFKTEMSWRRDRINQGVLFTLPTWDELKIYSEAAS